MSRRRGSHSRGAQKRIEFDKSKNLVDLIKRMNDNGNYFFYIQCGPEQNEISKNYPKLKVRFNRGER